MFLATTALSEFWTQDEQMLMLGPWCLRQDRRAEWQSLRYQVMSSPWNDRVRFYESCEQLDAWQERLLPPLADYLNAVHGVAHPVRYWRILVGPWLMHYLHAMLDRYVHLCDALQRDPGLQTCVLEPGSYRVAFDTAEFEEWVIHDPFNLQLYSQILQELGYQFPQQSWEGSWTGDARTSNRPFWRALLRRVTTWSPGPGRDPQLLVAGMGSAAVEMQAVCRRLPVASQSWDAQFRWSFSARPAVFNEYRMNLATLPSATEFERLAMRLLPRHLPTLFLEHYAQAREEIRRAQPRVPRLVVSALGWYGLEPFKLFAAEAAASGSRLIAVQHGAGYGMFRATPFEQHESRIADAFYVWGWADQGPCGARNLPSLTLSTHWRPAARQRKVSTRTVLFVASTNPRYVYRLYSGPQASQLENYIEWERRYLRALPPSVQATIRFRQHPIDFGHQIPARFQQDIPSLRWDQSRVPLQPRVRACRLVVIDHLGTPLLQVLAANVPTIAFWDPQRWEVREEVEPMLAQLREAGILWNSPEQAAEQTQTITDDPWPWWGSKDVQQVRQKFADRYALNKDDWMMDWTSALRQELVSAPPSLEEASLPLAAAPLS